MASADALAFTYSPHELERAARHGSDRLSSNSRRSPRRPPITTQALTRAVRSRSVSPHGPLEPAIRPQLDEDAASDRSSRKPDNGEDSPHISQPSYTLSAAVEPEAPLDSTVTAYKPAVFKSIPQKRARPLNDVDGPGTDTSSCKKRRLRRHLVTSRLSQPFSLPATHIHNRENGEDNTPCITRFLKAAATGAKRAGHESAMVRKAAILNSVRLKARQAAISRGHAELAELAVRTTFFKHGQQVVTAPTISTAGTRYPVSEGMPGHQRLPAGWRPHTTIGPAQAAVAAFAPPTPASGMGSDRVGPHAQPPRQMPSSPRDLDPATTGGQSLQDSEDDEEYGMAFPASDLDSRYADLSDDDMDDVYADFSAIFGPRSSQDDAERTASPHGEHGEDEHFYEEYLDELDGIPWMS